MFSSEAWLANPSSGFYNSVSTQSLRFDDGSSSYLAFTPSSASSSTDRRKVTHSFWVKRALLGSQQALYSGNRSGGGDYYLIVFNASDEIQIYLDVSSGGYGYKTSAKYRDVSAWYNVVLIIDTTQGTNTNRVKLYVNGVLQSLSTVYSGGYVAQNFSTYVMDGNEDEIGRFAYNDTQYFDGYMSEVILTIGQDNTISEFGELKNGVWIPIEYTGSYGTNGFRLEFKQTGTGTASASTIGADTSGNTNHWTSGGIVASDCNMPDSPENNFATMNTLDKVDLVLAEGSLKTTGAGNSFDTVRSTFAMPSGSWYAEFLCHAGTGNGNNHVGISTQSEALSGISGSNFLGSSATSYSYSDNDNVYNNGSITNSTGTTYTAGDIIGVTFTGSEIKWYKNNSLIATVSSITGNDYCFTTTSYSTSMGMFANFGQDSSFAGAKTAQGNTDGNGIGDFYYSPPSGFLAICTANLPEPTIGPNSDTQADDHFKTVIYNGSNNTQTITTGLQPDWIWIKVRSLTGYHNITDTSRGITRELYLNTTDDEENNGRVASSSTTGFTFPDSAYGYTNEGGQTFVSWNWHANGGSTSSNSDGSITSTVQANTTAGFSIATWTASGTDNDTIGHGLGVTPDIWILKSRSASRTWVVYNKLIDGSLDVLFLDTNSAKSDSSANNPTSTVVYVKGSDINTASDTMVGYFFAGVEGFSKFGSFTGNGNADGVYVALNFSPSFVMIKNTARAADWRLHDIARQPTNDSGGHILLPNSSSAEVTNEYDMDFLSNGFKMRTSSVYAQGSGETVIYMAFAETPFKYANAR